MIAAPIKFIISMSALCVSCSALAFSQATAGVQAPSGTSTSSIQQIFAAPLAQFKRSDLKKKLIQAANDKDENLVISLVEDLSELNPTPIPTLGLMGYADGTSANAPLNGPWKLLFTNAKDAEAPARTEKNNGETFGDEVAQGVEVKTGQRIDASSGECVNYIQLAGDAEKRPFDQLEITIQMTPLNDKRVRLDFMKGRALNDKAPLEFLKDFTFNFPPPSFNDLVARLRGMDPSVEPQAYFDILYIDEQIRAHKTGEGKLFVQMRD